MCVDSYIINSDRKQAKTALLAELTYTCHAPICHSLRALNKYR